jgi:flagellar basal-body rod modification protein FlgD
LADIGAITNTGAADSSGSSSKTSTASNQVTKDAFLQLLVAQIKNQDPLNPADGTQFLTQLAQFSELEQMIAIRQDLDGVTQGAAAATDGSDSDKGATQKN